MTSKDTEQFVIKGSKYRIVSKNGDNTPLISTGEFRGYAVFAGENALCLKMDSTDGKEGRLRFIPYHAVLAIDVISMAPPTEKEEKKESQVYYR